MVTWCIAAVVITEGIQLRSIYLRIWWRHLEILSILLISCVAEPEELHVTEFWRSSASNTQGQHIQESWRHSQLFVQVISCSKMLVESDDAGTPTDVRIFFDSMNLSIPLRENSKPLQRNEWRRKKRWQRLVVQPKDSRPPHISDDWACFP